MKAKTLLLGAAASLALAGAANAKGGWYVGIEGGPSWLSDTNALITVITPLSTTAAAGTIDADAGWALVGTVGHVFFDSLRVEGEVGYRDNKTTADYFDVSEVSLMVNVLYDIPVAPLALTIGAGAGYDEVTLELGGVLDDTEGNFAYQGIVGASWTVAENWDLTLTYRCLTVGGPTFTAAGGGNMITVELDDLTKHTLTVGARFRFDHVE